MNTSCRIALAVTLGFVGHACAQPCSNGWTALGTGVTAAPANLWVSSLVVFDNGSGPGLYARGSFYSAGGTAVSGIARWDGIRWSAVATSGIAPTDNRPTCMAVFDDGSGPALYEASGGRVTRLVGSSFVEFGSPPGPVAKALIVFDDGTGPALYAGGPGGAPFNTLGKWNGTTWSTVGGGVSGWVTAFGVYDDDGPGPHPPALYVGGTFDHAGSIAANGIAKWDGTSWSALGVGLAGAGTSFPPQPSSMVVYDDGTGPQLYVCGYFLSAGGQSARYLARWNGSTWSSNFGATFDANEANAMQVFDDGRGPALWLAGSGSGIGVFGNNCGIARWDGVSWTNPNTTPIPWGRALAIYDSGSGPGLYFGGTFSSLNGVSANNIARWGRPLCYPNCDGTFNSSGCPTRTANDFSCFLDRFAEGDLRANCDGSTAAPVLNVNDFMCFLNKFAAGCS